jgi:hypothetical protein
MNSLVKVLPYSKLNFQGKISSPKPGIIFILLRKEINFEKIPLIPKDLSTTSLKFLSSVNNVLSLDFAAIKVSLVAKQYQLMEI